MDIVIKDQNGRAVTGRIIPTEAGYAEAYNAIKREEAKGKPIQMDYDAQRVLDYAKDRGWH